ncbi:MAG: tubulin-like doman-containing protein [Rhizomicrobium sp.]|jgi:hypothetical protein
MAIQNLFLGFGGTGAHILTYVKELAVQKHGERPEHLEFLEFDTIARENWKPGHTVPIAGDAGAEEKIAEGNEISLEPTSEYFYLEDAPISFSHMCQHELANPVTRSRVYPQYTDWLHSDWLNQILPSAALNLTRGAAQQRQIGRYAMFANAAGIVTDLSRRLQDMQSRAGRDNVNVWIVGSAAGGTGAGCLIDAAYMTRLAAEQIGRNISVFSVVVLPDVYSDVFDDPTTDKKRSSLARSYAFLRELDRVQHPLLPGDRYDPGSARGDVWSEVLYAPGGTLHANARSPLFDYRIYLSRDCKGDSDRTIFFSSVANALDSFTDENVGSRLMQDQVNQTSAPIGFGASRLVLPKNTYAERFAWRQVDAFIRRVTAAVPPDSLPTGVASGSDNDRRRDSEKAAKSFLTLFSELLEKCGAAGPEELQGFARTRLSPQDIVEKWFQVAGTTAGDFKVSDSDLRMLPVLLYCNPFLSSEVGADDQVAAKDIVVKTYDEHRKSKGVKLDQKASGEQFADELLQVRELYLSADGGESSFEKGLRFVRSLNDERLRRAVDLWAISALQSPQGIAVDNTQPDEGTPLTRLYREVSLMVSPGGALEAIAKIIEKFKATVTADAHDRRLLQNANDAVASLRAAKRGTLDFGSWIEAPQEEARDSVYDYIQSVQKQRLLDEMQRLTKIVGDRVEKWRDRIRSVVVEGLVRGGASDDKPSMLNQIRHRINTLDSRLDRMARNGSILITLDEERVSDERHDTTMNGFEKVLEARATVKDDGKTLAEHLIALASWEAAADKGVPPTVALKVRGTSDAPTGGPKDLRQRLYEYCRAEIDRSLQGIDIFDYLIYAQSIPGRGITPSRIIERLLARHSVLLEVDGTRIPSVKLICRAEQSAGVEKRDLARSLDDALAAGRGNRAHKDPILNHSDPDAITLFGVIDPDGYSTKILDEQNCARDYLQSYVGFRGVQALTALTFHSFRAEEEMWFIERSGLVENNEQFRGVEDLSPPRITRLLEKPAMMRAFVHCLATGAIRYDEDTAVWQYSTKETPITLTGRGDDLLRAAVVFVLQQRASASAIRPFTVEGALEAATFAAQAPAEGQDASERTYPRVLKRALAEGKLDQIVDKYYVDKHADVRFDQIRQRELEQEARALKRIFRFYLPFESTTDLRGRRV